VTYLSFSHAREGDRVAGGIAHVHVAVELIIQLPADDPDRNPCNDPPALWQMRVGQFEVFRRRVVEGSAASRGRIGLAVEVSSAAPSGYW